GGGGGDAGGGRGQGGVVVEAEVVGKPDDRGPVSISHRHGRGCLRRAASRRGWQGAAAHPFRRRRSARTFRESRARSSAIPPSRDAACTGRWAWPGTDDCRW